MLPRINHDTKLTYTEPVYEAVLEVRMAPSSDEDQTNLGYRLRTTPAVAVTPYCDGFGNRVDLFNLLAPHQKQVVRATTVVRTHRRDGRARLAATPWPSARVTAIEAVEFLQPSPLVNHGKMLNAFVATLPPPSGSMFDGVEGLMDVIRRRVKHEKRITTSLTPVEEVLVLGRGVCQDFSHLFLGACRGLGLPARYVSGYIRAPLEIATHAWCQVWCGTAGWVDVDPTHGTIVADDHVVTAIGRDFSDVPPNRGVWKGDADETITVSVNVEPIERLPLDWGEWVTQAAWSEGARRQSWINNQKQGRLPRMGGRVGFRQQRSQQQQGRSGN